MTGQTATCVLRDMLWSDGSGIGFSVPGNMRVRIFGALPVERGRYTLESH